MVAETDNWLSPPESPRRPRLEPPAGATDCHAHVFGPFDRFPLAANRPYTPAELPGERYLGVLDQIGFARGVLVQPVGHGTDCGAMLHALSLDPVRLRGIALVRPDITDEQLLMLDRCGVRGARFSNPPPGLTQGAVGFDVLEQIGPRLKKLALKWHAQIWARCPDLEPIIERLAPLGLPLVVDHMGYFDVARGLSDPGFQSLLRLLREGAIWLKLTAYRLSARYPDYDDVEPYCQALLEANPERLLWGSDWPHVHTKRDMPDIGYLVDVFDRWVGDEALRRRILVDNPAALYGF